MWKISGLAHLKALLGVFGACILLYGLFSQSDAFDYSRRPHSGLSGRGIITLCEDEETGGQYDASWWCTDRRDCMWACPRCGARDNITLAEKCRHCTYSRNNPDGYLLRPVETQLITNEYSKAHRAIDFGSRPGAPVFAAEDGVVIEVRKDKWAGNVIRIRHSGGMQTVYGHLQESLVAGGSTVRMGEVIALSGNTGKSTGPHLHFEMSINGEMDNPLNFMDQW